MPNLKLVVLKLIVDFQQDIDADDLFDIWVSLPTQCDVWIVGVVTRPEVIQGPFKLQINLQAFFSWSRPPGTRQKLIPLRIKIFHSRHELPLEFIELERIGFFVHDELDVG